MIFIVKALEMLVDAFLSQSVFTLRFDCRTPAYASVFVFEKLKVLQDNKSNPTSVDFSILVKKTAAQKPYHTLNLVEGQAPTGRWMQLSSSIGKD